MAINDTDKRDRKSKEKREVRSNINSSGGGGSSRVRMSHRSSDRKRKRSTDDENSDNDDDDDDDISTDDDTRGSERESYTKRQKISNARHEISTASPPNMFQRARESLSSSLISFPATTTTTTVQSARDSFSTSSVLNREYNVEQQQTHYRSVINHLERMLRNGDQRQMARYHWELQSLYRLISDWQQRQQQQRASQNGSSSSSGLH